MKIFCKFPTVNISKLNFWLVICIAKDFIWTTLKMIFSIFWFFCILRFSNSFISTKYCPIITNHTSMESYLFSFQMMYTSQIRKMYTYDCFCAPWSHISVRSSIIFFAWKSIWCRYCSVDHIFNFIHPNWSVCFMCSLPWDTSIRASCPNTAPRRTPPRASEVNSVWKLTVLTR